MCKFHFCCGVRELKYVYKHLTSPVFNIFSEHKYKKCDLAPVHTKKDNYNNNISVYTCGQYCSVYSKHAASFAVNVLIFHQLEKNCSESDCYYHYRCVLCYSFIFRMIFYTLIWLICVLFSLNSANLTMHNFCNIR